MKVVFIVLFGLSVLYADFVKSGNTVTNNRSNLEWQDDTVGDQKTWIQAIEYCENLTLDSHDDWRLPNINELKSIEDKSLYNPAVVSAFTNKPNGHNWASTSYKSTKSSAWFIDFLDGKEAGGPKTNYKHVLCVRGGQL